MVSIAFANWNHVLEGKLAVWKTQYQYDHPTYQAVSQNLFSTGDWDLRLVNPPPFYTGPFIENSSTMDRDPHLCRLSFLRKHLYFPSASLAPYRNLIHWLLNEDYKKLWWCLTPTFPLKLPFNPLFTACVFTMTLTFNFHHPVWVFSALPLYLKACCPVQPPAHTPIIYVMHSLDFHQLLGADWSTAPENGQVRETSLSKTIRILVSPFCD